MISSRLTQTSSQPSTSLNPNSDEQIPTTKAMLSTNPFLVAGDDDDNSSLITQPIIKYDVPDPNRIPASVFSSNNNAAGMDWSVASNESLFSIHVGNNSFSRDHVFLMGGPNDPFPPPPGSDDLSAESLDLRDQQTGGSQDGFLYVEEISPSSYKSFNLYKEQEMSGSDFGPVGTQTSSPALASRSTTSQRSDDCSSGQSFAFPI